MTDKAKEVNPFKPAQPLIPGLSSKPAVAAGKGATVADLASLLKNVQLPPPWVIATIAIALLLGLSVAWWKHGPTPKDASENLQPPSSDSDSSGGLPVARSVPVGPGEVATTQELNKPWSAKLFDFHNRLTDQTFPAVVVRLPGGDYWGLALRAPYGDCELKYISDLNTLHDQFNVNTEHPMVVDPCDGSVFDLARYGESPNGLVRGEVIQGPALRPPIAIEIRVQGQKIIAVRTE